VLLFFSFFLSKSTFFFVSV